MGNTSFAGRLLVGRATLGYWNNRGFSYIYCIPPESLSNAANGSSSLVFLSNPRRRLMEDGVRPNYESNEVTLLSCSITRVYAGFFFTRGASLL